MRLLHTMLRVSNLDRSIAFYTQILGMTLHRKLDFPEGKFTLAFLGYGNEAEHTALELTHNWDTDAYELGTGYGHIAIEVEDVYQSTEMIEKQGCKVLRPAGPMNAGSTVIAFVADPDGYPIELIGSKA